MMHPSSKDVDDNEKSSKKAANGSAMIYSAMLFFITFLATLYLLYTQLISSETSLRSRHVKTSSKSMMKNVELKNGFDHEISIYYEDGDGGMFLSNLDSASTLMMNVAIGQRLYVTEPEDWERIDYIAIQSDIDKYTFSPHELQRQVGTSHVHLNIDRKKRQHPQIVYFYEKTSYSDLIPVVFR